MYEEDFFEEDLMEEFSEYAQPCKFCGDLGYPHGDVYVCDRCNIV